MSPFDLKSLRAAARLTQEELAKRLGIDQSQVSRYEAEPSNMPASLLFKWLSAVGTTPAKVLEPPVAPDAGCIDVGEPYVDFDSQVAALLDYIGAAPPQPEKIQGAPTAEMLRAQIEALTRKPRLVLAGQFDAGKSRLANSILGGNYLPTGYQPETRVPCYIRHLRDRPDFIDEEVWMMDAGFDPERWTDPESCPGHRHVGGTLETLIHYGTKEGRLADSDCSCALVFIDAPILLACEIVDLPGTSNDSIDDQFAKAGSMGMDALLYLSMSKGFMSAHDLAMLGYLLKGLPDLRVWTEDIAPLQNLLVVATHADPSISDEDLQKIKDRGASRVIGELSQLTHFGELEEQQQLEAFQDRQVSFWFESGARREDLETKLSCLLREQLPLAWRHRMDRRLPELSRQAQQFFSDQRDRYEQLLTNLSLGRSLVEQLKQQDEVRTARVNGAKAMFRRATLRHRDTSRATIEQVCARHLTLEAVETLIAGYETKAEAKELAALRVLELLQEDIASELQRPIGEVAEDVTRFLKVYTDSVDTLAEVETDIDLKGLFNAQSVFASELRGTAQVGALSAWIYKAGDGLPRLLVGEIPGIGLPGYAGLAAVAGAVVLAFGGFFVAAAAAAFSALSIWRLFGESWERRLARKLLRAFHEHNLQEKLQAGVADYWTITQTAFDDAADRLEASYRVHLDAVAQMVEDEMRERRIQEVLHPLEQQRDFYAGLPWQAAPEPPPTTTDTSEET